MDPKHFEKLESMIKTAYNQETPDPEKDLPDPDEDMKILEACEEYSKTGFDEFDFYATYYDD